MASLWSPRMFWPSSMKLPRTTPADTPRMPSCAPSSFEFVIVTGPPLATRMLVVTYTFGAPSVIVLTWSTVTPHVADSCSQIPNRSGVLFPVNGSPLSTSTLRRVTLHAVTVSVPLIRLFVYTSPAFDSTTSPDTLASEPDAPVFDAVGQPDGIGGTGGGAAGGAAGLPGT